MAKFHGAVGYATPTEISEGVWQDVIHEVEYSGDVLRNSRQIREGERLNYDLTVQNSISIIAVAYAQELFFFIRYVEWAGAFWTVEDVTAERPRIVLRLGGIYNGPRADRTAEVAEAGP